MVKPWSDEEFIRRKAERGDFGVDMEKLRQVSEELFDAMEDRPTENQMKSIRKAAKILGEDPGQYNPDTKAAARKMMYDLWGQVRLRSRMRKDYRKGKFNR